MRKRTETDTRCGYLALYIGPMGSCKTTRASEAATRYAVPCNISTVYVNHELDKWRKTSGGEYGKFSSHNASNVKLSDSVSVISCDCLRSAFDQLLRYDAIIIDEGQFYPDLPEVVRSLVNVYHKRVEIYGLDGDYKRENIGRVLELIPEADHFEKMTATCIPCLKASLPEIRLVNAPFTRKIKQKETGQCNVSIQQNSIDTEFQQSNVDVVHSTCSPESNIEEGGMEKYEPVCRYHHLEKY